jgi:hypothetical protein
VLFLGQVLLAEALALELVAAAALDGADLEDLHLGVLVDDGLLGSFQTRNFMSSVT